VTSVLYKWRKRPMLEPEGFSRSPLEPAINEVLVGLPLVLVNNADKIGVLESLIAGGLVA